MFLAPNPASAQSQIRVVNKVGVLLTSKWITLDVHDGHISHEQLQEAVNDEVGEEFLVAVTGLQRWNVNRWR